MHTFDNVRGGGMRNVKYTRRYEKQSQHLTGFRLCWMCWPPLTSFSKFSWFFISSSSNVFSVIWVWGEGQSSELFTSNECLGGEELFLKFSEYFVPSWCFLRSVGRLLAPGWLSVKSLYPGRLDNDQLAAPARLCCHHPTWLSHQNWNISTRRQSSGVNSVPRK